MKMKYILAFVAVAAVIVFGAIKGWFKGKSASTQGTSSLILPSFGSSGGNSNSGSSITISGNVSNTSSPNTVSIIEPSKASYFYSNNQPPSFYNNVNNKPVVKNYTFQDDNYKVGGNVVWLSNQYVKIGIDLFAGGCMCYISKADSSINLINNAIDFGRQIQIDAYQKPYNYQQEGEIAGTLNTSLANTYNTTMGGDGFFHTVSLIDYHSIENGYYIKLRPLIWGMNGKISEIFIEARYTLDGNAVKCEYTYHSFRTDGQYGTDAPDGAAIPACFLIDRLNYYKMYKGNNPWTNDATTGGKIPITVPNNESVMGDRPNENWIYVYNPNDLDMGIGLFNPKSNLNVIKQISPSINYDGSEFTGGFTYMHSYEIFNEEVFNQSTGQWEMLPFNNRDNFTKVMTAYLAVGRENEIRNKFYQLHSSLIS